MVNPAVTDPDLLLFHESEANAEVSGAGEDCPLTELGRRQAVDAARTLAAEWTQKATTPEEKVNAILTHLRTEYRYDLNSPSGKSRQPLDDFLFESKRGHCEFYSTAMAVMPSFSRPKTTRRCSTDVEL